MARPIWSGVINFGLVTVPVQMYTATQDHTIHFRQLQRGTSDRVRNKRVNERTGKPVDYDDIVKGYEIADGEYVVVEPEELEEIAPGRSRAIDVSGFVQLSDIDPVYFARPYYLAPRGEEYTKPYELLRAALAERGKVGVATFVMRNKEYLVALRPQDDVLLLQILHWSDEVREPQEELPSLPEQSDTASARGQELRTAEQLVDTMTVDWNPEDYADVYEDRVRELVAAKAKGEEITSAEEPPEATNVIDLSEALARSLEQARGEGGAEAGRGGTGRAGGGKKSAGQRQRSRRSTGEKRGTGRKQGASKKQGKQGASEKRGKQAQQGKRGSGGARERLADLSKDELYRRATERGVPGRSSMNRAELVEALGGGGAGKAA